MPTENSETQSEIKFYQCLNKTMKINIRDITVVMGDMNAKARAKNDDYNKLWETWSGQSYKGHSIPSLKAS